MPFELEFDDAFEGNELDRRRWLPYYLPHWSTWQRAAARYELGGGCLTLRIEADQEPWCPEWDGEVRVSSLQTGLFAGGVRTTAGQHRFNPDAVVRNGPHDVRLYTPLYGRIELRAKATADPDAMVSLWMIGLEDEPERSGEICVCEIFGRDVDAREALVGMGIRPFRDPRLVGDFTQERLAIDAREVHRYAVEWTPDSTRFFVDADEVKAVAEAPTYPLQLMLGIYEFRSDARGSYPKEFVVESVRGYRLVS